MPVGSLDSLGSLCIQRAPGRKPSLGEMRSAPPQGPPPSAQTEELGRTGWPTRAGRGGRLAWRELCSGLGSAADLQAGLRPVGYVGPPWAFWRAGDRAFRLRECSSHTIRHTLNFTFLHVYFFLCILFSFFGQNQLTFLFPSLISIPPCRT